VSGRADRLDAPITLEGETLSGEEQRLLLLVWLAQECGLVVGFEADDPLGRQYLGTIAALVARGACHKVPRGRHTAYAISTPRWRWIAETVFAASGLDFCTVMDLFADDTPEGP
jgi:hypothetical protein